MANKQINQYPAAVGIDAINDQLLIDPGGTGIYNKINRNTLLGITGAPLGTTDTQTVGAKTFINSNSFSVKDSSFTLQDDIDATKLAQFQLSSITTGTTRIFTVPNASVTLASLTGTETFTNKTITSPIITGGTIDNSTITVDSIAGHTSGTIVTVANMQISNGVINSANAVTATSIAAGAVQPQALVAGTGNGWSWQTWAPTWTNLTIGNATATYKYIQIGKSVFFRINITFGSTSSMGTTPTFTLPTTAVGDYASATSIGLAYYFITSQNYVGRVLSLSTTTGGLFVDNASATYSTPTSLTPLIPGTWTSSSASQFTVEGFYESV